MPSCRTSTTACRRQPQAVSTHFMAIVRAAPAAYASARSGSIKRPPPSGHWSVARLRVTHVGYEPTVCGSVQESNLRQPDFKSGALPTELTDVDIARSEPAVGTHPANPRVAVRSAPPASATSTDLACESNGPENGDRHLLPDGPSDALHKRSHSLSPPPSIRKRRRWESNPLEPGCSRSPCRLAPAS